MDILKRRSHVTYYVEQFDVPHLIETNNGIRCPTSEYQRDGFVVVETNYQLIINNN